MDKQELQVIKPTGNSLTPVEQTKIASEIYTFCASTTPAIYKNKSVDEIKLEISTIKTLTSNIKPDILNKMINLAIKEYPVRKSEDHKLVFDIHYIMTFFKLAEWYARNHLSIYEDLYDDIDSVDIS